MFEAVYVADSNNNLVYEYLINLSSPTFKSLVNIIANIASEHEGLIEINNNYSVYLLKTANIIIYTLNSADINPLLPYCFIQRLIEVIYDYFGYPLAIPKIESNNDTLTLLINQMLDDGIPNITDFNKLKDIVPFKSFLSKILSKTNELTANATNKLSGLNSSGLSTASNSSMGAGGIMPNTSNNSELNSIPWRRSNVRYTNNEMYVDVVETIDVILKASSKNLSNNLKQFDSAFYSSSSSALTNVSSKNLIPIAGTITGEINFTCHLTGVPYLQMILNTQGLNLTNQVHRCVKLDKWKESNGNLSFIPPDGKFKLMDYSIDLHQYPKKEQLSMLGAINIEYNYGLGANRNEFEIKLYLPITKGVSKVENIVVEVNSNYANLINIKSNRLTQGDFSYKGNGKGEWNLRSLSTGVNPILYGCIITDDLDLDSDSQFQSKSKSNSPPSSSQASIAPEYSSTSKTQNHNGNTKVLKPSFLKLSYSNKGSVPSRIKVDSLKVLSAKGMGETVKPYKGVKYLTKTGDFVIRS